MLIYANPSMVGQPRARVAPWVALILILLACGSARFDLFSTRKARAEPPSPVAIEEARKQFKGGIAEARQGRWPEALLAFQASYALAPHPAALFNLAGAQYRTGKLLVSNANYRRFAESSAPGIGPAHREAAETQMARIEASIPRLRITVDGMRPEDRLLIDSHRIYANELDHDLWIDPGPHTISFHRPGGHEEVRRIVLTERDRRLLQFRVF